MTRVDTGQEPEGLGVDSKAETIVRTDPVDPKDGSLRKKVIQGGAFFAFRQGIGVFLSLAGVLLVTRVIGPKQYGIFAMANGIVTFLFMVGTWGLDVYLLRKTEEPTQHEFDQAFSVLFAISLVFFLGIACLSLHIASFVKTPGLALLLTFLAAAIPFNLLAIPAIVKLDRHLNFKQVAINELLGQSSMYLIAIPLAFAGAGAWAPSSGFVLQQLVLMVLSYWTAKYKPSFLLGSSSRVTNVEVRTCLFQLDLGVAAAWPG